MPARYQIADAFKEFPESEFPHDKARDAYRRAKKVIRDAWARCSQGKN